MTTLSNLYTGAVGGVTFGIDQDAMWESAPAGLGVPIPDTSDVGLPVHGSSGGVDRVRVRSIKIPLLISETTDALALTALETLKDAWIIDTDTTLDLRLSDAQRTYYGRCRGLDLSHEHLWQGTIEGILAHFDCLDPWGYTTAVAVGADSSSPVTLTNSGNTRTKRVTLTIVGNGGTPVITNTTDPDSGDITFRTTLANLAERSINLRTETSTAASVNKDSEISPSSTFFDLLPGNNTITFTGCTSVAASIESAYQ